MSSVRLPNIRKIRAMQDVNAAAMAEGDYLRLGPGGTFVTESVQTADVVGLSSAISTAIDTHTHDGLYYRRNEVDDLLSSHTHDARYYTRTTLDAMFAAKVDASLVGNTADQIPLLDGSGRLVLATIPDLPISRVTNLQTTLDAKATTSSLGSAAFLVAGAASGQVPVLGGGGVLSLATIPTLPMSRIDGLTAELTAKVNSSLLGSAAYVDVGGGLGDVPVLDAAGLLSAATIPALPISRVTGLQTALDARALAGDLGTAAARNTGTAEGNVPLLLAGGLLAPDRIPAIPISRVTDLQSTLDGKAATSAIITSHAGLSGLLDDDHTQYVRLQGRGNFQIIRGGVNPGASLSLVSTTSLTRGRIYLGATGLSYYDDVDSSMVLNGLSMAGHVISNVATPTVSSDAATKGYVDVAVASGGGGGGGGPAGPDFTYTGDDLTRIDYDDGSYKVFTYDAGKLSQIDFTSGGTTTRKTFVYSGDTLIRVDQTIL